MMAATSETTVRTAKAASYLLQLCKHFGHRIEVQQSESEALFHFEDGMAGAYLAEGLLRLTAVARTEEQLHNVEDILGSHLERFAFREGLIVDWPGHRSNENGDPKE